MSQVSRAQSVSTRALRYYEEMGLIHSRRIEGYAYRVYDEDTVRRIEQILFLRSVRIPLRDIAVLLCKEDTREAIEIFRRRIAEMDAEIDQLTAVRRLLRYLQEKVSVSGSERWKESVPLLPEDILLPRENSIPPMPSLPQDVRILSLPRTPSRWAIFTNGRRWPAGRNKVPIGKSVGLAMEQRSWAGHWKSI